MFSAVLEALKVLGSAIAGLHQLGAEKRKKFATLCDQISAVLDRFIQAIRSGQPKFDLCAELREYVEPLRTVASGAIFSNEIDRLATALNSLCDAWKRAEKAGSSGHASAIDLRELEEGAGLFRGFANTLRAT